MQICLHPTGARAEARKGFSGRTVVKYCRILTYPICIASIKSRLKLMHMSRILENNSDFSVTYSPPINFKPSAVMSGASEKIANTDLELTVRETTLPTEAGPELKVFAASDQVRNNEHLVDTIFIKIHYNCT